MIYQALGEEQQDQQVISAIRAGHIPLVYCSYNYCQLAGGVCLTMLVSKIWTVANSCCSYI